MRTSIVQIDKKQVKDWVLTFISRFTTLSDIYSEAGAKQLF